MKAERLRRKNSAPQIALHTGNGEDAGPMGFSVLRSSDPVHPRAVTSTFYFEPAHGLAIAHCAGDKLHLMSLRNRGLQSAWESL